MTANSADNPQPLGLVINQVKDWVERCGWVWVEAQIIELRRRNSGMQFLTMRDPQREFSATVICSTAVLDAAGPLTEGSTVVANITPTVWPKSGRLSFSCSEIRIVGEGRLLAELEQRKRKLQAEGLFDPRRKRRLPFLPRVIGLVTGKDSRAERDVVENIRRRWPAAAIRTEYSLVQGPQAARQVIDALGRLDADQGVEVIVIARGGGSLEDLLPFSDEGLVRAIAAASTPVVSAIGHEPDTPISDLVADLRASTPTDAAKRVVPDAVEQFDSLAAIRQRLRQAIVQQVVTEQRWLDQLRSRPALHDPSGALIVHNQWLATARERLRLSIARRVKDEQKWLETALVSARRMSPKATLERGYAIAVDGEDRAVSSVSDVEAGDQLRLYVADGQIYVEVDYQEE